MRELTEQEKEAKKDAWDKFLSENGKDVNIHHRRGFAAGFVAGLEYQQSRIDELDKTAKTLGNWLAEKEQLLIDKDNVIFEMNKQIDELERALKAMQRDPGHPHQNQ